MRLTEHQGKTIFKDFGIPIPKAVLDNGKQPTFNDCVVKAQLLEGKRGKRGLIKFCKKSKLKSTISSFHKKGIHELLIEEKLNISKELYLSLVINRLDKCITLIYCDEGGIDIEELASKDPKKFVKVNFFHFDKKKLYEALRHLKHAKQLVNISKKLYIIMKKLDCSLAEINPLVISNNKLIAADSKIVIDDNALHKYPSLNLIANSRLSDVERDAKKYNLQYVELQGNIAVIGNGAGLVMATLDVLKHFKGKPANFLDVGGGADVKKMTKAMEIVLEKKSVHGILINIFGGITRCDDIAKGLIEYKKNHKINLPIVVRMIGTNEKQGKKLLSKNKIHCFDSMEEAAKKIVRI